jgi:hypothetical protein
MNWVVYVPFDVRANLAVLRNEANKVAGSPTKCQWQRCADEFAISFESVNAAVMFVAYCERMKIRTRKEWPSPSI